MSMTPETEIQLYKALMEAYKELIHHEEIVWVGEEVIVWNQASLRRAVIQSEQDSDDESAIYPE